jgi:tetratricopeptide (TPR) repeat protein
MKTKLQIPERALLFAASSLSLWSCSIADSAAGPIPPAAEKALLTGDWSRVAAVCQTSKPALDPPVLQAIRGHALLVANENCESLRLFLSLTNRFDHSLWNQWTEDFEKEHPSNSVALYLHGDALARLGKWEQAVACYTNALAIEPRFALAHNALGVAHVRLSKPDLALEDFERACRFAPDFADAQASLGAFWLMREAPEGALAAFKSALARSPSFPLALVGQACAMIGFSQDPRSVESALTNLASALPCEAVRRLTETNLQSILRYAKERWIEDEFHSEGMTLKTRDLLFRDNTITHDQLRRFSTSELTRAFDRFGQNAQHSERWGGIADKLSLSFKDRGFDLTKWSDSSFRDAQDWRRLEGQAYMELKSRGINPFQGGARTQDLQKAYTDRGKWPFTMWFGLAQ